MQDLPRKLTDQPVLFRQRDEVLREDQSVVRVFPPRQNLKTIWLDRFAHIAKSATKLNVRSSA